jgi:hypothetical protein
MRDQQLPRPFALIGLSLRRTFRRSLQDQEGARETVCPIARNSSAATRLPVTFRAVRHIYSRRSMPRMITMPSTGLPVLDDMLIRIAMLTPGMPGAPTGS